MNYMRRAFVKTALAVTALFGYSAAAWSYWGVDQSVAQLSAGEFQVWRAVALIALLLVATWEGDSR